MTQANHYDDDFYRDRQKRTEYAAETLLTLLVEKLQIKSVVDFGCGIGTWLRAARKLGIGEQLGIEGNWVPREYVQDIQIMSVDLSEKIKLDKVYDLAISLEVAEHLPADRAHSFVKDLVAAGRKCLFGAAIENQGGAGHVNEQWQSYWSDIFRKNGYLPVDIIRPAIWSDENIDWWYRQNTILYVPESEYNEVKSLFKAPDHKEISMLDVVHPKCFSNRINEIESKHNLSLKQQIKIAAALPLNIFRRILRVFH